MSNKINLKFAELHTSLFLNGKNFGLKLDPCGSPDKFNGIKLIYDREFKELHVVWGKETAIIPSSNVVSMTEGTVTPPKVVNVSSPQIAGISRAQVETPMGHVHMGEGHGKTGKTK